MPLKFDQRSATSAGTAQTAVSQWESESDGDGEGGRQGRSRRRLRRKDSLGNYYGVGSASRSGSRKSDFEKEDEAIEITRAELDRLREKIDQARSEAGYSSSSRASSRSSSRHGSRSSSRRRAMASTNSVDPDFADEKSVTVDGSSMVSAASPGGGNVLAVGAGLLAALGDDKPQIWDEDEMDDPEVAAHRNAHNVGSAVVPQKVVEKYDKAKRDYEAALKAKKDKKDALRREEAQANPGTSSAHALAKQFSKALSFGREEDERKVRKQMDYKNTAAARRKAARYAAKAKEEAKASSTFYSKLGGLLFGCCMGARK